MSSGHAGVAALVALFSCTSGSSTVNMSKTGSVASTPVSSSVPPAKEDPPMTQRARRPAISPPTVETMPIYVRGFPMHMAMTVTALPATIQDERRVPRLDMYSATDIRATFTRESDGEVTRGGQELTKSLPRPSLGEADDTMIDVVDLEPGEPRRMLFDGAQLQEHAPLAAGRYRAELVYRRVAAMPFEIVVRDATAAERQVLAQLAKRDPDWMIAEPSGAQPPPIAADDPLRYLRVLHYLYTTPTPPPALNLRFLDGLAGFYAPEATLLRFELARLRSDAAAEDAAAATIQSQFPTMLPALRELKVSGGTIALKRAAHEMSQAERRRR